MDTLPFRSGHQSVRRACVFLLAIGAAFAAAALRAEDAPVPAPWWSPQTAEALDHAGANRPELLRALADVPAARRESLAFLLENMPARDLRVLSAKFLLENVALAADALERAPWGQTVPREIFLNDVLPYANASERRDDWRADLRARCLPLIEGCRTPAEAARRLNERLFNAVNVHYSTARARPDQSPAESIRSGLASCTGLSILLVDACRSVSVPARLVGIPDWSDGRGNHTWVEIWDAGRWHFAGAAEPDPRGLDHAWFERDAALAQKDSPTHAIYAVSFRRTALPFPLAWGPDSGGVSAENITGHYTAPASADPAVKPMADGAAAPATRLMIRIRAHRAGPRVAASVRVASAPSTPLQGQTGTSKDERADANDMLAFDLPRNGSYDIVAEYNGHILRQRFLSGDKEQEVLDLDFDDAPAASSHTALSLESLP